MYARGVREDENKDNESKEANDEEFKEDEEGIEKLVEPNPFFDEKYLEMDEVWLNMFIFSFAKLNYILIRMSSTTRLRT